jgi:hypothetical protein
MLVLPNGLRAVHAAGEYRVCGVRLSPGPHIKIARFADFQTNPVLDLAKLAPYDRPVPLVPIRDQGAIGSCVVNALIRAAMIARLLANMTFRDFSPAPFYALVNGGVDNGCDPRDALEKAQNVGLIPLELFPPNDLISLRDIPESAFEIALRFRLQVGAFYQLYSFSELVTAAALGDPCINTIRVGANFGPDPDGVVGVEEGDGNHMVFSGGGYRRLRGQPQGKSDNSWTPGWGLKGSFYYHEDHILAQPHPLMFAIRRWLSDPLDPLNPPE